MWARMGRTGAGRGKTDCGTRCGSTYGLPRRIYARVTFLSYSSRSALPYNIFSLLLHSLLMSYFAPALYVPPKLLIFDLSTGLSLCRRVRGARFTRASTHLVVLALTSPSTALSTFTTETMKTSIRRAPFILYFLLSCHHSPPLRVPYAFCRSSQRSIDVEFACNWGIACVEPRREA